jgi:kynurenine formamidase
MVAPEKVLAALATPTRGKIYPLGQPVQQSGVPVGGHGGPVRHLFVSEAAAWPTQRRAGEPCIVEDYVGMRIHGQTTHIDALGHVFRDGHLYNGFSEDTIATEGLGHCGIEHVGGIVTRGVLLDVAGHSALPNLPGGHTISAQDLRDCLEELELVLQPGDAVLLHTGWGRVYASDPEEYRRHRPGIGLDAATWLAETDVMLVGADTTGVETRPFPPGTLAPVHQYMLRDHGIYFMEMLQLDAMITDHVTSFLLIVAPLQLTGGTGSPVNPLAIT